MSPKIPLRYGASILILHRKRKASARLDGGFLSLLLRWNMAGFQILHISNGYLVSY